MSRKPIMPVTGKWIKLQLKLVSLLQQWKIKFFIRCVETVIASAFHRRDEKRCEGTDLKVAAQNCWLEDFGAFTGENSPATLAALWSGLCYHWPLRTSWLFPWNRWRYQQKLTPFSKTAWHQSFVVVSLSKLTVLAKPLILLVLKFLQPWRFVSWASSITGDRLWANLGDWYR